jgi:hypothetical protein
MIKGNAANPEKKMSTHKLILNAPQSTCCSGPLRCMAVKSLNFLPTFLQHCSISINSAISCLQPWSKSDTCPLSPLKWLVAKTKLFLKNSSWPKLTVAQYLSLVPWLVAGDRNSANLSPVSLPAELI